MLDKIAQGHAVDGMEALSPALVDGMELLVDLLPTDTHVLVCDPELVRGRAHRAGQDQRGVPARVLGRRGRWRPGADRSGCLGLPAARRGARRGPGRGLAWWTLSPFSAGPVDGFAAEMRFQPIRTEDGELVDLQRSVSGPASSPGRAPDRSARPIAATPRRRSTRSRKRLRDGWRVVVDRRGQGTADRLAEVLTEHDLPVRVLPSVDEAPRPVSPPSSPAS